MKENAQMKLKQMELANKKLELDYQKEKDALFAKLMEKLEKERQSHLLQMKEVDNKNKVEMKKLDLQDKELEIDLAVKKGIVEKLDKITDMNFAFKLLNKNNNTNNQPQQNQQQNNYQNQQLNQPMMPQMQNYGMMNDQQQFYNQPNPFFNPQQQMFNPQFGYYQDSQPPMNNYQQSFTPGNLNMNNNINQ